MTRFRLWPEGPHPGQAPVWNLRRQIATSGQPRTVFLPCGPRWGKDRLSVWLCLAIGLRLAAQRAESTLIPKVHQWVVAPYYKLTEQLWREYREYTKPLRPNVEKAAMRITLPGDYVIEWRTADNPESLDGVGLDIVHVTEAAEVSDDAWTLHLKQRLTSPGRLGFSCINGTPGRTPSEWYRTLWRRAEEGDDGLEWVNAPSWDNPHLSLEQLQEIQRDRVTMPEAVWRATYGAELVHWDANVFRRVREASTASPVAGDPRGEYVTFVDLAQVNDFNAAVTLRVDGAHHNRPAQVHADRWNKCDWPASESRIAAIGREYPGNLAIDITGDTYSDPLVQRLREAVGSRTHVYGTRFTNANKHEMVTGFAAALESGSVVLLRPDSCEAAAAQMRELQDYTAEKTATGNVRYNAPPGRHDDMAVACFTAYAMAREIGPDPSLALEDALGRSGF